MDSDDDDVMVLCMLEAEGLLNSRDRTCSIHPFHDGQHHAKFFKWYSKIRQFEDKFFLYYRMSVKSFDELLTKVGPLIYKQSTNFRIAVSPEARLTITLRFLASGTNFTTMQYEFNLAPSTISVIVHETCQVIWDSLKHMEMPVPTEETWLNIADGFYEKANFPNCVGAVDGKHIRCTSPKKSGSKFFNYKKYFSVVLMAVVDANLNFVMIDVGAYGQEGDSTVFRNSPLGKLLYSNRLNLPPPRLLPNTAANPQPFVFVGDEAFKIHTNLLRPFPQRALNGRKRVFNYRLSRSRRTVECAFGILANKWRVFHTPIMVDPKNIDILVKACCVLHNFVRRRDGVNYEDTFTHPFADLTNIGPTPLQRGGEVRDFFADYFMGPGAVPFQSHHNY